MGHFNFLTLPKEKDSQKKVTAQLRFCFFPEACWKTLQSNLQNKQQSFAGYCLPNIYPVIILLYQYLTTQIFIIILCWVQRGSVKNQISNSEFSGRTSDNDRHNSQCADIFHVTWGIKCTAKIQKTTVWLLNVGTCRLAPTTLEVKDTETKGRCVERFVGSQVKYCPCLGGTLFPFLLTLAGGFNDFFWNGHPPNKFAKMKPSLTNYIKL